MLRHDVIDTGAHGSDGKIPGASRRAEHDCDLAVERSNASHCFERSRLFTRRNHDEVGPRAPYQCDQLFFAGRTENLPAVREQHCPQYAVDGRATCSKDECSHRFLTDSESPSNLSLNSRGGKMSLMLSSEISGWQRQKTLHREQKRAHHFPKSARRSSASSSGCSSAAKCPPRGMLVQRRTSYTRSIHDRGGNGASIGKCAMATGTCNRSPLQTTEAFATTRDTDERTSRSCS